MRDPGRLTVHTGIVFVAGEIMGAGAYTGILCVEVGSLHPSFPGGGEAARAMIAASTLPRVISTRIHASPRYQHMHHPPTTCRTPVILASELFRSHSNPIVSLKASTVSDAIPAVAVSSL